MQPGWYPDPTGRFEHRYHNGSGWTADVSTDGQRMVDAFGVAPSATRPVPAAPGGGPPPPPGGSAGNGLATAAMVLGIIGAVFGAMIVFFFLAAPLGILALVFGLIGRSRARTTGRGRGASITGLVLGPLAVVLSVVGVIIGWDELRDAFREARDSFEVGNHSVDIDRCQLGDGGVVVAGTLINESTRTKDYDLLIEILHRGDGRLLGSGRTTITELDPDDAATFELTVAIEQGSGPEIRCSIAEVSMG